MPFLRFSRDKRGYEHTYLVQTTNRRGKSVRPRLLYWYRTPPGLRVGRPPFDEEVRRALEAQNPDVDFDWTTIAQTSFPPPETVEPWRERRRAERAARQARREGDERQPAAGEAEAEDPSDRVSATVPVPAGSNLAGPQDDLTQAAGTTPSPARKRRRRGGRRARTSSVTTTGSGADGGSASNPDGGPVSERPQDAAEEQD